ncbi:hypothetical protein K505DRAFT_262206, partial [Melanomma pulvis-pyrius CBS 109.77]
IIPYSKITLKSVLDKTIIAVFSSKIHIVIKEYPIQAKKIAEGKRLIECILIIFLRSKSTISLAIGLS